MIHFDRVVSAWLILRFVDCAAQFVFLAEDEPVPADVTLFGVPGAALASHDGRATTFARILDGHSIDDPALARMRDIVADAVDHVMHDVDRAGLAARDPHVAGVLAVAEGIMLLSASDDECLARSLPLYDALYARLQAGIAIARRPSQSASVLEHAMRLSDAAAILRATKSEFSGDALARALQAYQAGETSSDPR
jgi:hypothetical protein